MHQEGISTPWLDSKLDRRQYLANTKLIHYAPLRWRSSPPRARAEAGSEHHVAYPFLGLCQGGGWFESDPRALPEVKVPIHTTRGSCVRWRTPAAARDPRTQHWRVRHKYPFTSAPGIDPEGVDGNIQTNWLGHTETQSLERKSPLWHCPLTGRGVVESLMISLLLSRSSPTCTP